MTAIPGLRPVPDVPSVHPSVSIVGSLVMSGLTGALAGHLFSIITPVGGAIFGVTNTIANLLTHQALNALGCNDPQNIAFIIAKTVIPILVGAGVGALALAAGGIPITFTAALLLTGAIFVTNFLVVAAITTCCVGTCILAGVASTAAAPRRTL